MRRHLLGIAATAAAGTLAAAVRPQPARAAERRTLEIVVNKRVFDKLPADQQAAIRTAAESGYPEARITTSAT